MQKAKVIDIEEARIRLRGDTEEKQLIGRMFLAMEKTYADLAQYFDDKDRR